MNSAPPVSPVWPRPRSTSSRTHASERPANDPASCGAGDRIQAFLSSMFDLMQINVARAVTPPSPSVVCVPSIIRVRSRKAGDRASRRDARAPNFSRSDLLASEEHAGATTCVLRAGMI